MLSQSAFQAVFFHLDYSVLQAEGPKHQLTPDMLDCCRYTFDSRANRENPDAELCRMTPDGGRSCVKVGPSHRHPLSEIERSGSEAPHDGLSISSDAG